VRPGEKGGQAKQGASFLQTNKERIKLLIGLAISALALYFVFRRVDWSKLHIDWAQFQPGYTALGVLALFLGIVLFGIRWKAASPQPISARLSVQSMFLAYGANVFLPGRGGDFLRLAYLKQRGVNLAENLMVLVFEKLLDFAFVIALAFLVFYFFAPSLQELLIIPGFLMVLLCGGLLLALRIPALPAALLRRIARLHKRLEQPCLRLEEALFVLSRSLGWPRLSAIVALTIPIWLGAFPAFYYFSLKAIGLELSLTAMLLLTAMGALGVALPSAPSALGVFHAAVLAAMEAAGYAAETGVVAAVYLHLLTTAPVAAAAGLIYLVDFRSSRNRSDSSEEKANHVPGQIE